MLLLTLLSSLVSVSLATTPNTTVSLPAAVTSTLASVLPNNVADVFTPPVNNVTIGSDTYVYEALVGAGIFPSDARDQFGDTCGGWGSAIAADVGSWKINGDLSYSGIIYTLPDRGWNTNGTVDFQARIHKFEVTFHPWFRSTVNGSANQLVWNYISSTLLFDYRGVATTGLDADFIIPAAQGFPDLPAGMSPDGTKKVAMDSEGLVLNSDGTFFVSDEYGPYVYHFTSSGQMIGAIAPPEAIIPMRNGTESFSADSPPRLDPTLLTIPANPTTGRQNNQGFEGMTISPDGTLLFVLLQSSCQQDGGTSTTRRNTRLLQWDLKANKWTGEWIVQLPTYNDSGTTKIAAQSEMHYLAPNRFLILPRDSSKGFGQASSTSIYRHIDIIDISGATNIIGSKFDNGANPVAPKGVLDSSVTPAILYPFIDFNLNSQLSKFGLINGGPLNGPGLLNEKWESIAVLPTFRKPNEYFIISANDNDFVTQNGFINFGQTPYKDTSGFSFNLQSLAFLVEL